MAATYSADAVNGSFLVVPNAALDIVHLLVIIFC